MHSTTYNHHGKQFSRNFHIERSRSYRLKLTGSTDAEFDLASQRKHWLAMERILKAVDELRKVTVGYLSINLIMKQAEASFYTVKEALKHTLKEVSFQLLHVFSTVLSSKGTKDIKSYSASALTSLRSLQKRKPEPPGRVVKRKSRCKEGVAEKNDVSVQLSRKTAHLLYFFHTYTGPQQENIDRKLKRQMRWQKKRSGILEKHDVKSEQLSSSQAYSRANVERIKSEKANWQEDTEEQKEDTRLIIAMLREKFKKGRRIDAC